MTKSEFLAQLEKGLMGLPKEDREDRLTFYAEMIEDRIEDGIPEEDAVRDLGSVTELTERIIASIPLTKLVKERMTPKRKRKTWETVLLCVGSPLWLALLIVACAVILVLYAVLWAVMIALWAVFVSLAAGALGGWAGGIALLFHGGAAGIVTIGAGFVCAGLAVGMFFACRIATKGILRLTKKLAVRIKRVFVKKEEK